MTPSKQMDEVLAVHVRVGRNDLSVDLNDGRRLTVPLEWFPRLWNATNPQRPNWKLRAGGYGITWPDLDEDLSVGGLLAGGMAKGGKARPIR